jgi:predicted phosphodiesterase
VHQVTGDKDTVQAIMRDTVAKLEERAAKSKKAGSKSLSLSSKGRKKIAPSPDAANVWREGLDRLEGKKAGDTGAAANVKKSTGRGERAVKTAYAPRDQIIALFQSAMDEYLDDKIGPTGPRQKGAKKASSGKALSAASAKKTTSGVAAAATIDAFYKTGKKSGKETAGANVLAQFGNLDPRWVEVVTEKAKVIFKGKRKFIPHKAATDFRFPMDDETTVAIVGDWGGGNDAAQAVAQQIQKLDPSHVIHLGDVYYAGTPKEVKERFLKFWPKPKAPGHSFALNSNHEMYSGGYGYFDTTLKQFQQPASYFSLTNDNWRIIGLDTGYNEHDLIEPQADWLKAQLAGKQKNILLSHHQLFSAYEKTDASKLRGKVQGLLDKIYGWIWGHEHLAVVYEEQEGIKAVCLGNGCFPYKLPKGKPAVPVKWLDKHQGNDKDYPGGHTFALLRIKGPRIDIDFIDHLGNIGNTETWK